MSDFFVKNRGIVIFILIFAFLLQAYFSLAQKSITEDEEVNISSGYSYLKTGELKLKIENPPLIKILGNIFILPLKPTDFTKNPEYQEMGERDFSKLFIFENKISADKLTFFARILFPLLGAVLAVYVYLFAKELWGKKAGLFAIFLYSFSPNILAHTPLVTSDLAATLFIFSSSYYFWRYFKTKKLKFSLFAGLSFGFGIVSKFTVLYLGPLTVLFFGIFYLTKISGKKLLFKKIVLPFIIIFAIAWVIVWILYLPLGGKVNFNSEDLYTYTFLPDKYIEGVKIMKGFTSGRGVTTYFMGEYKRNGWWYYYPVMLAIKIPLAALILFIIALISGSKKFWQKDFLLKIIVAVVPLFLFFYILLLNKRNIGFRHLLPILPFLFIFTAFAVKIKNKKVKIAILVLSIWYFLNALWIYPDYLMYFNQIAGGPDNAWKISIRGDDWGQDYLGLKKYLNKEGIDEVYLIEYKKSRKRYFQGAGIKIKEVECGEKPESGIVAARILHTAFDDKQCYKWLKNYEPFKKIGYSIWLYDFNQ